MLVPAVWFAGNACQAEIDSSSQQVLISRLTASGYVVEVSLLDSWKNGCVSYVELPRNCTGRMNSPRPEKSKVHQHRKVKESAGRRFKASRLLCKFGQI